MIGLSELAAGLAGYLTAETGVAAFAGRVENPVYPCCLVEAAGKTRAGTRQLERSVTVTLVCYGSRRREREEGLQLLDRMEAAVAGGFTVGGRRFCPKEIESCINGKELPQVRFTLEFYDVPYGKTETEPESGAETMGSLALRWDAEKEE
ncbi:MAG: hypothetical protein IJT76_06005 [Clostridia bacterium]|nr:hypothetical protein [Clostridia bacterium]